MHGRLSMLQSLLGFQQIQRPQQAEAGQMEEQQRASLGPVFLPPLSPLDTRRHPFSSKPLRLGPQPVAQPALTPPSSSTPHQPCCVHLVLGTIVMGDQLEPCISGLEYGGSQVQTAWCWLSLVHTAKKCLCMTTTPFLPKI